MSGVIPFPYRQSADFLYLTGVQQPGCAMLLKKGRGGGGGEHEFVLLVPPSDPTVEVWEGRRLCRRAAVEVFRADRAHEAHEMAALLRKMAEPGSVFYWDEPAAGTLDAEQPVLAAMREELAGRARASLREVCHDLRWVKSPAEVACMRRAAAVTCRGIREVMRATEPGQREAALAARFEFVCRLAGAQRLAYPPVVAGGADACTIHYSRNDKELQDGSLLLVDLGCELDGYASDVSRVWPVGGRFHSRQLEAYEAVRAAHRRCLEICRPGSTLREIHALSVELLTREMTALGIGSTAAAAASAAAAAGSGRPGAAARWSYRTYYPHALGHYLGMDTHDTSSVGLARPLAPGCVITVEPGLYFPAADSNVPPALRGLGVRLEDMVLITQDGHEVLSAGVPLSPREVESCVGSHTA